MSKINYNFSFLLKHKKVCLVVCIVGDESMIQQLGSWQSAPLTSMLSIQSKEESIQVQNSEGKCYGGKK